LTSFYYFLLQSRPVWGHNSCQVAIIRYTDVKMPEKIPLKTSAWQYASEGTQLAVTLLLGLYAGYKLDEHKGTQPWFLLAGAALGLGLGLYNFLRRFLK